MPRAQAPDLIVCDVMMPPPDGFEVREMLAQDPGTATIPFIFVIATSTGREALLRELQVRAPGLPVIAMRGHVMDMDVEALQAAGFAGGLLKPLSIDDLLTVLSDALGGADT